LSCICICPLRLSKNLSIPTDVPSAAMPAAAMPAAMPAGVIVTWTPLARICRAPVVVSRSSPMAAVLGRKEMSVVSAVGAVSTYR
jgi:hypothetical protein